MFGRWLRALPRRLVRSRRWTVTSHVALAEVRRARICRDFPQIGAALMAGRIGVGQIDELVRIDRNERAARYLDVAAVDMLLDHAEHLPIRSFTAVADRWLTWADPDGAWSDAEQSIDQRTAHVVAANGEVVISATGGGALTAEALGTSSLTSSTSSSATTARRAAASMVIVPASSHCRAPTPNVASTRWWRSSNGPTRRAVTARCPIRWSTCCAINAPSTTC